MDNKAIADGAVHSTIGLKELILHFFSMVELIWSKKYWLLGSLLIFLGIGIFLSIKSERLYHSKLTFIIDDQSSNLLGGGIGDLIGNFGFSGLASNYSLDKILAMSKSQAIIYRTLLKKVQIEGESRILANEFIDYFLQEEDWYGLSWFVKPFKEEDPLHTFKFQDSESYGLLGNRALWAMHNKIVGEKNGDGLLNAEYGETNLILQLDILLKKEELAYHFIQKLYESLSQYYVEKSVEKQRFTYEILSAKADSIYSKIKSDEYQLANFSESYRNLIDQRDNIRKTRLNREIQKNSILYAEVLKNVEIADFSLKNNTPFIQVLDVPRIPLPNGKFTLFKALIFACILGTIIPIVIILLHNYYKKIMDN